MTKTKKKKRQDGWVEVRSGARPLYSCARFVRDKRSRAVPLKYLRKDRWSKMSNCKTQGDLGAMMERDVKEGKSVRLAHKILKSDV